MIELGLLITILEFSYPLQAVSDFIHPPNSLWMPGDMTDIVLGDRDTTVS
jgi:hypothetical protein